MKQEDPGRRTLIVEQWWCGLGVLIFWAAAVFLLCRSCHGAEITLRWDQPPGGPEIIQWHIYRISPGERAQLAIVEEPSAVLDAADGDHLVVTASSAHGESPDSAVWIVRLPMPDPIIRVTLQASKDLATWDTYQTFDIRRSSYQFFRLRTETPPPP